MFIAAFGVAFIAYFLGGKSILFAIIGGVLGFFIPRFYVKREQGKRLVRFNNQLGDMLNLMVTVCGPGTQPRKPWKRSARSCLRQFVMNFGGCVQEMQLGVSMEVALENTCSGVSQAMIWTWSSQQ